MDDEEDNDNTTHHYSATTDGQLLLLSELLVFHELINQCLLEYLINSINQNDIICHHR